MQKTINGEEVVRVTSNSCGIAPTSAGYTLAYSFDGKQFTSWPDAIPVGEPLVLNGAIPGMLIKLLGNADNVDAML